MSERTLHVEEKNAYASALCCTCRWKLSACDDEDTAKQIRRSPEEVKQKALEHAYNDGHKVSMIESNHLTFDYRVP